MSKGHYSERTSIGQVQAADFELEGLWAAYVADRENIAARNKLSLVYMRFLRFLGKRYHLLVSDRIPLDDLISHAYLKLLRLLKAFSPGGPASFTTYAYPYLFNTMRHYESHEYRRDARGQINTARRVEIQRRGRRINEYELACSMGISEADLARQVHFGQVRRRILFEQEDLENMPTPDPNWDNIHRAEIVEVIGDALKKVPETYRAAVNEVYLKERYLKDVGADSGNSAQLVYQRVKAGKRFMFRMLEPIATQLLN